jgi:hypothetical protein
MIPQYGLGLIADLGATFSQDGVPINPTNPRVTIYNNGTEVLPAVTPVQVLDSLGNPITGYYTKQISIPLSWDLGYYDAIWTGLISGIPFSRIDRFEVIEQSNQYPTFVPTWAYCNISDVIEEVKGIDFETLPHWQEWFAKRIIYNVTRVNNKVGRTFNAVTTANYFDGTGTPELNLPYIPILSIDKMVIRITPMIDWWTAQRIRYINCVDHRGVLVRTPDSDADIKNADLLVDCVEGKMRIPERILYLDNQASPFWNYTFLRGVKNIYVSWTYGYTSATIPDDIRLFCAKLTAIDVLRAVGNQLSGGSVNVIANGFSRSYAGVPFAGQINMLQDDIAEIRSNYSMAGVN